MSTPRIYVLGVNITKTSGINCAYVLRENLFSLFSVLFYFSIFYLFIFHFIIYVEIIIFKLFKIYQYLSLLFWARLFKTKDVVS